jgi:hypothetical protein
MKRRIRLEEALRIWVKSSTSGMAAESHIPDHILYEFYADPRSGKHTREIIKHLSRCTLCMLELNEIAASTDYASVMDFALPKAAASDGMQWPKQIPTDQKKYLVVIRRSMAEKNKGVVTLQVEPSYRNELEGKRVAMRDGRDVVVLRGEIINGEVSHPIDDLDQLILRFSVEPDAKIGS